MIELITSWGKLFEKQDAGCNIADLIQVVKNEKKTNKYLRTFEDMHCHEGAVLLQYSGLRNS